MFLFVAEFGLPVFLCRSLHLYSQRCSVFENIVHQIFALRLLRVAYGFQNLVLFLLNSVSVSHQLFRKSLKVAYFFHTLKQFKWY